MYLDLQEQWNACCGRAGPLVSLTVTNGHQVAMTFLAVAALGVTVTASA